MGASNLPSFKEFLTNYIGEDGQYKCPNCSGTGKDIDGWSGWPIDCMECDCGSMSLDVIKQNYHRYILEQSHKVQRETMLARFMESLTENQKMVLEAFFQRKN